MEERSFRNGNSVYSVIRKPEDTKDTTGFFNFIEKAKIGKDTILVLMDPSSLFNNYSIAEGEVNNVE